jgi:hypothetical protein
MLVHHSIRFDFCLVQETSEIAATWAYSLEHRVGFVLAFFFLLLHEHSLELFRDLEPVDTCLIRHYFRHCYCSHQLYCQFSSFQSIDPSWMLPGPFKSRSKCRSRGPSGRGPARTQSQRCLAGRFFPDRRLPVPGRGSAFKLPVPRQTGGHGRGMWNAAAFKLLPRVASRRRLCHDGK